MKVSIHQPSYFPWLGQLNKIAQSDLFVLLDSVPLNDAAYQHRNVFLNQQGQAHLLSIPLQKKGYLHKPLAQLSFAQNNWQIKHWKFLQANYAKAAFWHTYAPALEQFYQADFVNLGEALSAAMRLSLKWYGIQTPMVLASSLNVESLPAGSNQNHSKTDLVLQILHATNATHYLSGTGAKAYQDEQRFADAGIGLEYQDYQAPSYPQPCENFVAGLSGLDALLHLGSDARKLL